MSCKPANSSAGGNLKLAITMEPESWILRRFGSYLKQFVSEEVECHLLELDEPIPKDTDAIIYANWSHLYARPPLHPSMPGALLVGHMDRTAFRLRYLLWKYSRLQAVCMAERWVNSLQRYWLAPERLRLIPHGIDLSLYAPAKGVISSAKVRIGFVGRAYPDGRKGEDRLLNISRRLDPAKYEFVLVGDRWQETVTSLQGRGFEVTYHQMLKTAEIPAVMTSLDVLLVCARNEGGPQPVLEALACAVPVLSTDVGFVPELKAMLPDQVCVYDTTEGAVSRLQQAKLWRVQSQAAAVVTRQKLEPFAWQTWAMGLEVLCRELVHGEVADPARDLQPDVA